MKQTFIAAIGGAALGVFGRHSADFAFSSRNQMISALHMNISISVR